MDVKKKRPPRSLDAHALCLLGEGGDTEELVQALERIGKDPTVHDHLGDIYLKLGKTREAIGQWQASIREYESGTQSELDPAEVAKINKKLEGARVRLARENNSSRTEKR